MNISRSRMWVRRSFALTLLAVFLASLYGLLSLRLCASAWEAGVVAFVPTGITAYWIWLAGKIAGKFAKGINAGPRN